MAPRDRERLTCGVGENFASQPAVSPATSDDARYGRPARELGLRMISCAARRSCSFSASERQIVFSMCVPVRTSLVQLTSDSTGALAADGSGVPVVELGARAALLDVLGPHAAIRRDTTMQRRCMPAIVRNLLPAGDRTL
ncbi:MAG: hypothetical protein H7138_08565 [Myxococcales bacterium]|nr:hypothetical protein [Myxococcales bacterium]